MFNVPYLSYLTVSGSDAATFLDAQFSVNVSTLNNQDRRLACWSNAKGQVIAALLVIRDDAERFTLILSADLIANVQQRMRMYVLRSQVTVEPGAGVVCAPSALEDQPLWRQLQVAEGADPADADALSGWRARDIEDGLCWLDSETSEQFLPQMLGMPQLNALDYKKGCYPGQEVIARAHYLGRVKRRLWRVSIDTDAESPLPLPGTPLAANDGQPAGTLMTAANCGSSTIGLAVLHDNHRDTVLSYESDGTSYTVSAVNMIGESD